MRTGRKLVLGGTPNEKQRRFFASRKKYIAYGGSRGGGKSWALRRKLILMACRYAGLRCLIVRRTFPELRENHILPMRSELEGYARYSEAAKCFTFPNGSRLKLGYCNSESDVLQYQGQEYDIIAIDEATQLTEYQFNTLKACVRGANGFPKRMYLTCNPGGVGHGWVKRLFLDRQYREGERGSDYEFIPATVYDNDVLLEKDPEYVRQLESLPSEMKQAWLYGRWDLFEGQYFREFSRDIHVCEPFAIPPEWRRFAAFDYGFDCFAALLLAVDFEGRCTVYGEFCRSGLTLSQAAGELERLCEGEGVEYAAASPDLWSRRQESGYSGVEIMQSAAAIPPLIRADNRRIDGWRVVREYLKVQEGGTARLQMFSTCSELIRCLPLLTFDRRRPEDASDEPHAITHAPEALRYALMSRACPPAALEREDFSFMKKESSFAAFARY